MEEQRFERLFIPVHLWIAMQAHVEKEAPIEACGILGGNQSGVDLQAQLIFPARNELHSAHRYRMDAHDQLDAFNQLEEVGLDMVGIYHSHPQGPSTPSIMDIKEAYYPDAVYLIWAFDGMKWDCRGYSIQVGVVQEIPVIVNTTMPD